MQRRGAVEVTLVRTCGVLDHKRPHLAHPATRHSLVDELVGCVREGGADEEDV